MATLICSGAKTYANETFDANLCANTPEITASKMPIVTVETKAKNKLAAPVCPQDLPYCYVCFKENQTLSPITGTINISNSNSKRFFIYGLNLLTSSDFTPLLTLSGSTTLLNSTLTGSGTGAALKIDAKDVTIDTATISKFAYAVETGVNSENVSVKNSTISEASILLAGKSHTIDTVTISNSGTALQLNGSNITLQDSSLTSSGTVLGVADGLSNIILKNIQLTGKDTLIDLSKISSLQGVNSFTTTGTGPVIKIPANYGEFALKDAAITGAGHGAAFEIPSGVKATIGPNNSFTNFATGIEVKQNATANVTQNKFTNVTAPIYWETPFWATDPISTDWLGKHISDTDATKVDRIAGKLDLTECKGSVEMYKKEKDIDKDVDGTLYPIQYHTTCTVATVQEKALKLTAADKSEKEIAIGACYFDCDKLDVSKDHRVSLLYSSATSQTTEFMPLSAVKVSELGDVISVMGPLTIPIATSGVTGSDEVPQVPDSLDPTADPKAQTEGVVGGGSSGDDGGPVGQGTASPAAGCTLIR